MAITPYLAITGAEFESVNSLPDKVAWMACHFSPYSAGLSNLPKQLPENAVIILNDMTPFYWHKKEVIAEQLSQCIDTFKCTAVLLDFQRPPNDEICALAENLLEVLPCPTIVSEVLASQFPCPVFLSPCPLHRPLEEHIEKWSSREIWLDVARETTEIELTERGAEYHTGTLDINQEESFHDDALYCRYSIACKPDSVNFTLWRTRDDFLEFLSHAEELGIQQFVGLYQELQDYF